MPHGTPDWGLVGPKHAVYGLDDLGEHAVRVGSPHLWDRRGDVLYMTTFREGLGTFLGGSSGAGAEVALCTGYSRQGGYCIRLRTGSTLGQAAYIQTALPFQDPSCVGLEFSFGSEGPGTGVRDEIMWYDGASVYRGWALYDFVSREVRYYTGVGVWVVLATGVWRHYSQRPEHTMKLVVDMGLNEYVRLLLDELAWDMRGIPVAVALSPSPPYWSFTVYHYGTLAANVDALLDNVIITQNEPR